MLAAIEHDDWPEAAHTHAPVERAKHPLGVFDPRECGAWVDTLRALRALPNRARLHAVPVDASAPGADEGGDDR